jgi:DNA-binding transcriptional LysR family regulator
MARALNLRQIEAFKAVIEHGTVSLAAEILHVSQPAVSKLVAHLEEDTELKLFDRAKGRLAVTEQGMRLYEEVDRIFAGLQQVETAVEEIKREHQGRLLIGTLPALSGVFIQRATMNFLASHPKVYCSIESRASQWVLDSVLTRKLDIGIVSSHFENQYVVADPLLRHPLLCIMPLGHPLASREVIEPQDLDGVPFVSFSADTLSGQRIAATLAAYRVQIKTVLTATVAPTVCQFVAAGLGVSLVHPLFVAGLEESLVVRRFEPEIPFEFKICRARDSRNSRLIEAFVHETNAVADRISVEAQAGG